MLKINVKNPNTAQYQLEYVMYMMLSSYYRKARCLSKRMEQKLYLYYMDLTKEKQYILEDNVIRCIEAGILCELDEKAGRSVSVALSDMECVVRIENRGDHHVLRFASKGLVYGLRVTYEGKEIKYRLIG